MKTTIIIVLGIFLLLALGFITADIHQEQLETAREEGMEEGALQTIAYLFTEAQNCMAIPISMENYTINLIAMECLQ